MSLPRLLAWEIVVVLMLMPALQVYSGVIWAEEEAFADATIVLGSDKIILSPYFSSHMVSTGWPASYAPHGKGVVTVWVVDDSEKIDIISLSNGRVTYYPDGIGKAAPQRVVNFVGAFRYDKPFNLRFKAKGALQVRDVQFKSSTTTYSPLWSGLMGV